ncbi:hypothetical protein EPN90_02330 [Patescibacteria group bacterium]|nr:MAG: hypothetical protein EPN90_02330 [Patescibacteria group bacterium]
MANDEKNGFGETCDFDNDESPTERRKRIRGQREEKKRERLLKIHQCLSQLCRLLKHDEWRALQP